MMNQKDQDIADLEEAMENDYPEPLLDIIDPFINHPGHFDHMDCASVPDCYRWSKDSSVRRDRLIMPTFLRILIDSTSLTRITHTNQHKSPEEWLKEIATGSRQFFHPMDIPASDRFFTDHNDWTNGTIARKMDAFEAQWPYHRSHPNHQPFALVCWAALDLQDHSINEQNKTAGYIVTHSKIVYPMIGPHKVPGPWLFFGAIARPAKNEPWACLKACAQPIHSLETPFPVYSQNERRAVTELQHIPKALHDDPDLTDTLRAPFEIALDKPLYKLRVKETVLPDFYLVVNYPSIIYDTPIPDQPKPYTTTIPYIINLHTSGCPPHLQRPLQPKYDMMMIGHAFNLETTLFDSKYYSLKYQCDRITRHVRRHLLGVWHPHEPYPMRLSDRDIARRPRRYPPAGT